MSLRAAGFHGSLAGVLSCGRGVWLVLAVGEVAEAAERGGDEERPW
jgi:hypothetical protein